MTTPATWMRLRAYPRSVKLTLAVYALAFAFGTCVHVAALLWCGPPPHPILNHPLVYAYADSLTVLDPLVILLLLRFPRAGLLLAVAIMLTDVGKDCFVQYVYFHASPSDAEDYVLQVHTAFLGFVLGSAPFLWSYLGRKGAA
jgi:membrane protein HdeD